MITARTTQGPDHAVPCPHCGLANDFREIAEEVAGDTNLRVTCDHCDKDMLIQEVRKTTVFVVRQAPKE